MKNSLVPLLPNYSNDGGDETISLINFIT